MSVIGVVNYGMGNIQSIEAALKYLRKPYRQVASPHNLDQVDVLVLPGVGGFPRAIASLQEMNLIEPITSWANEGRRIVGICLGMQLLYEQSTEMTPTNGLGLMRGSVHRLLGDSQDSSTVRLPNIGWRELVFKTCGAPGELGNALSAIGSEHPWMYFAHSFAVSTEDVENVVSTSEYCGINFPAIVQQGNVIGFQGHPEISGHIGLRLLDRALSP